MNQMHQTDLEDKEYLGRAPAPGRTFTVPAAIIASAIATALRSTDNGTIPILSHVHLSWADGAATMLGTDMEIATAVEFAIQGGAGACVVPAQGLSDAVRRLPAGAVVTVTQAASDGDLVVSAGRFRATLKTMALDDFPRPAPPEMQCRFEIAATALRALIENTRFAASTSDTRYYLQGVYLHVHDGRLRAVATDGALMAIDSADLPDGAEKMPNVIVPLKALGEILKITEGVTASPVVVEISPSRIRVACRGITMTSKLIDGTFPDYQRVIPRDCDNVLLVTKAELVRVVETVAPFSDVGIGKASRSAVCAFTLAGDGVTVASWNGDKGEASDELTGASYSGEALRVGVMSRGLLAVCGALRETVSLAFGESGGGFCLITEPARPELLYVMGLFKI